MIVVEKLNLTNVYQLWWTRQSCGCRTTFVLHSSWGGRLIRIFLGQRVHLLSREQMGRGHAVAFFLSVKVTEAMLEQWRVDPQVEAALLTFFGGDKNILLVHRKCLLQWVEGRIAAYQVALLKARERGCTKVTFVAADLQSLRLLRCWREVQQEFSPEAIEIVESKLTLCLNGLRSYLLSWIVGFGLLAKVVTLLVRRGIVIRPPKRQMFPVALHNQRGVTEGRPGDMWSTDFLVDGRRVRREDLLVVISGKGKDEERKRQYTEAGIAWAGLFELPLPLQYLSSLLPRLLGVVWRLCVPGSSHHSILRLKAAGAVLYGIYLEVFLHHYDIGVLLNDEEHSHPHIVETVVLNKYGGRTAWITHAVAMWTHHHGSYIHYDLLPVQGSFPVRVHAKTWSPGMAVIPVGMPANDAAKLSDEDLASENVRELVQRLKAAYKIVGVFTASYTKEYEFVIERYRRFFMALAKLAQQEEQVRLVIKPKARTRSPKGFDFLVEEPFKSIIDRGIKNESIFILDPLKGLTCTAQYLIRASDVIVSTAPWGVFGSVWVEALLLGKPSYVYAPSEFRLAPFGKELFDRWIFDDEERLVQIVLQSLKGHQAYHVDENIMHWFDPFNDGRAIERLREEILKMMP